MTAYDRRMQELSQGAGATLRLSTPAGGRDGRLLQRHFFVPPKARWPHIRDEFHENIGAGLNKALGAMEEVNPALEGVLAHIDFTRVVGKSKIPDTASAS